jgi:hypothetical protein
MLPLSSATSVTSSALKKAVPAMTQPILQNFLEAEKESFVRGQTYRRNRTTVHCLCATVFLPRTTGPLSRDDGSLPADGFTLTAVALPSHAFGVT